MMAELMNMCMLQNANARVLVQNRWEKIKKMVVPYGKVAMF